MIYASKKKKKKKKCRYEEMRGDIVLYCIVLKQTIHITVAVTVLGQRCKQGFKMAPDTHAHTHEHSNIQTACIHVGTLFGVCGDPRSRSNK